MRNRNKLESGVNWPDMAWVGGLTIPPEGWSLQRFEVQGRISGWWLFLQSAETAAGKSFVFSKRQKGAQGEQEAPYAWKR